LSVMFVLQEALSFGGGGILIEQRQVRWRLKLILFDHNRFHPPNPEKPNPGIRRNMNSSNTKVNQIAQIQSEDCNQWRYSRSVDSESFPLKNCQTRSNLLFLTKLDIYSKSQKTDEILCEICNPVFTDHQTAPNWSFGQSCH
jgi:hypothetical protein